MYQSLSQIQTALKTGELTCEALVSQYLQNIEKNKHLNAFLEVYSNESIHKAKEIDKKIAAGNPLHQLTGLVIGLKDTICYKNHSVQASSKILNSYTTPYSATVVERLENEGAIIIGRQNCDEFAMGASNENSAFGNVLNADDTTKVPGGSSGGSAVAVQADMCLASLGSDTGGSVRQPAAFCGLVGIKPTYSRVSRYGLIAYASSFDQIGVLTKTVEDNAKILEVISGYDAKDATSSQREVVDFTCFNTKKKYKIAYIQDVLSSDGLQNEIKIESFNLIEKLRKDGHIVEPCSFPFLEYMVPTYYILTTAEASSNLARFDGVRYGHRSEKATNLLEMYTLSRSEGFGEEVKRRIMLGTFVLSSSYYDAYYTKAQKVRRILKDKTDEILSTYDFILSPTTPTTAFKIGQNTKDPIQMYLADIFTVQAPLVGIPAISIPIARDNEKMSIGIQLMTKSFNETELYNLSKRIEELVN